MVLSFLKFGDTLADVRVKRYRVQGRRYVRKSARRKWTNRETERLRKIVDLDPDLFLDEIQERMAQVTGRLW
jgi:hypothetical protein